MPLALSDVQSTRLHSALSLSVNRYCVILFKPTVDQCGAGGVLWRDQRQTIGYARPVVIELELEHLPSQPSHQLPNYQCPGASLDIPLRQQMYLNSPLNEAEFECACHKLAQAAARPA